MSNDTKRRLVLSKWETARETEREWQDELDAEREQVERLEAVLLAVRDWMHEPLFLSRPMRDPRVILRKVEDAL